MNLMVVSLLFTSRWRLTDFKGALCHGTIASLSNIIIHFRQSIILHYTQCYCADASTKKKMLLHSDGHRVIFIMCTLAFNRLRRSTFFILIIVSKKTSSDTLH